MNPFSLRNVYSTLSEVNECSDATSDLSVICHLGCAEVDHSSSMLLGFSTWFNGLNVFMSAINLEWKLGTLELAISRCSCATTCKVTPCKALFHDRHFFIAKLPRHRHTFLSLEYPFLANLLLSGFSKLIKHQESPVVASGIQAEVGLWIQGKDASGATLAPACWLCWQNHRNQTLVTF